jgi:hypothetical protein
MKISLTAAALLSLWLGGCASDLSLGHALVPSGGYDFFDCGQLAKEEETLSQREKDLALLMERAKQSPGGTLVSGTVYESDRATALASLEQVRRAQTEKRCNSAPATTPPATRARR